MDIVRTKAWKRKDTEDKRKQFLMTLSDIENCTFQPNCGRYADVAKVNACKKSGLLENCEQYYDTKEPEDPQVFN